VAVPGRGLQRGDAVAVDMNLQRPFLGQNLEDRDVAGIGPARELAACSHIWALRDEELEDFVNEEAGEGMGAPHGSLRPRRFPPGRTLVDSGSADK
jgi:hypothetical protein